MAEKESRRSKSARWAEFRFAVIGPLLAAPPPKGDLHKALEDLAANRWTPPGYSKPVKIGLSTIERWYYQARANRDPVTVLRRKLRTDRGIHKAIGVPLCQALHAQYAAHRRWTYQLHYDNLAAAAEREKNLGTVPAYSTIRRYMKAHGLFPQPRRGDPTKPGVQRAEERLEAREVRSWEVEQPNALWHLDFHSCSRQVLTARGERVTPHLLGIIDDHSRLCCHLQWYLAETAENLIHGLCQDTRSLDAT